MKKNVLVAPSSCGLHSLVVEGVHAYVIHARPPGAMKVSFPYILIILGWLLEQWWLTICVRLSVKCTVFLIILVAVAFFLLLFFGSPYNSLLIFKMLFYVLLCSVLELLLVSFSPSNSSFLLLLLYKRSSLVEPRRDQSLKCGGTPVSLEDITLEGSLNLTTALKGLPSSSALWWLIWGERAWAKWLLIVVCLGRERYKESEVVEVVKVGPDMICCEALHTRATAYSSSEAHQVPIFAHPNYWITLELIKQRSLHSCCPHVWFKALGILSAFGLALTRGRGGHSCGPQFTKN